MTCDFSALLPIAATRLDSLQPFDYVMAPLKENIYARARIVEISEPMSGRWGEFAYLHFIDDGVEQWMSVVCVGGV